MKNKYFVFTLVLVLMTGIWIILLNLPPQKTAVDNTSSTPTTALVPTSQTQVLTQTEAQIPENQTIIPKNYNSKLNSYTDRSKQYSLLYPNNLDLLEDGPKTIGFSNKGTDGPWLINISANETAAKDVYDWLKRQNKQRGTLPPMTILKTEKRDGTTLLYLKDPVAVDEKDGKPVYSNTEMAIIMKNQEIFEILKRELWPDPNAYFQQIVGSFHFL